MIEKKISPRPTNPRHQGQQRTIPCALSSHRRSARSSPAQFKAKQANSKEFKGKMFTASPTYRAEGTHSQTQSVTIPGSTAILTVRFRRASARLRRESIYAL